MSHHACLSDGSESVLTLGPIDYQLILDDGISLNDQQEEPLSQKSFCL